MPCKTPHQSTTSVIIVSVTLTFPVCSCMMKLKRCWINQHNLSRWTPRSLDISVSFLNTSHLPSSHPAQRDTLQRAWRTRKSGCGWRRGSKRLQEYRNKPLDFRGAVYQKTSSDWEPGEPERFTRSERTYRLTCSQRTIWIECCLHFKSARCFTALVFVHIHPIKRSRKHYKEFSDCFGFSVNDLTMNSGLPELKERAKHWLHLYYLFFSFLLYVCVLDFLWPPDNQNSVFWGKNIICDIEPLASHIFRWKSVIRVPSQNYSRKNILLQKTQAKRMRALIHTHTLDRRASLTRNSLDVFRVNLTKAVQVIFDQISLYCKAQFWEICLIIMKIVS